MTNPKIIRDPESGGTWRLNAWALNDDLNVLGPYLPAPWQYRKTPMGYAWVLLRPEEIAEASPLRNGLLTIFRPQKPESNPDEPQYVTFSAMVNLVHREDMGIWKGI